MAPCSRCGTFLCGECIEVMDEAAWCADCVAWLRRNGPTSRGVKWLIGLGIVTILASPLVLFMAIGLNLPVGVLGLVVPLRELRRIRAGERPVRGRWQAYVAMGVAGVNLLLALLWLAAFAYWFVLR